MKTVLRFKKKKQNELFVVFILVLSIFYGVIDLVKVSAIKYTMDLAWIFLLVTLVLNRYKVPNEEMKGSLRCIWAFWIITLIGFIINANAPQYYLWGLRNNFRFFVYFIACVKFLDGKSIKNYLQLMTKAYYLHFLVAMIQYFVFGIKRDHLGGIFGTQDGNNGFSLIFMLIIMTYSLLCYLNHRETLIVFIVKGIMAVLISAYSELKFFFVIYTFVVMLSLLFTNFSYKKLYISIFSIVGVLAGIELLSRIFPNWAGWFSWENMVEMALSSRGYTGRGDLNRLTAIPVVWNKFLDTWVKRLIGLGLGNCDNASFGFLTTTFYKRYSFMHYHWFSSSIALLETGLMGFCTYFLFFVATFWGAGKLQKNQKADSIYCQLSMVMSAIAMVLLVYNQSMRTEAAYMVYFVMALPFIESKSMNKRAEAPEKHN